MKDFKYILRLTLTLLLITAVVAGLLGLVNGLTEDRIDALKREKAEQAMQEVLPAHRYDVIDFRMDGVTEAYRADNGGYVVRVSENGFGGEIDMMVGVSLDGKVCGVSIISHSETASLGDQIYPDTLCAKLCGAYAVTVRPIAFSSFWLKLRYWLEFPFRLKYQWSRMK